MNLDEHLRSRGFRATTPRRVVWDVLSNSGGHLTAEQIHGQAGAVNLASVYRALATLSEVGLVRETNIGLDDASRWEPAHADDQFHLVCVTCGNVEHHGGDLVESVRSHVATDHGFAVESIELSVSGRCGDCA